MKSQILLLTTFYGVKNFTDLSSPSVSFAPRCSRVSLHAQKTTWTCDWRVSRQRLPGALTRPLDLDGPKFEAMGSRREMMLMDFVSSAPHIFLWKDIMFGWTMTECHGCEPELGSQGGGV